MKQFLRFFAALLLAIQMHIASAETFKTKTVEDSATNKLFKSAIPIQKNIVIEDSRGCLWGLEENERGLLEVVVIEQSQQVHVCRQWAATQKDKGVELESRKVPK